MKNVAGKTRKADAPYASWVDTRTGWKYRLLKSWQGNNAGAYTRWLMDVEGFGHDVGDTYVHEMFPGFYRAADLTFDTNIWSDRLTFIKWAQGAK